jgi:hypothetical protein
MYYFLSSLKQLFWGKNGMADDQPPPSDSGIPGLIALALVFFAVGTQQLPAGKTHWAVLFYAVFLVLIIIGLIWRRFAGAKRPGWAIAIDSIFTKQRIGRGLIALMAVCIIIIEIGRIDRLRADIDTYLMPRIVTDKQVKDLCEYLAPLAPIEKYPVIIMASPRDPEARNYASKILSTLVKAGWKADRDFKGSSGKRVPG